MNILFHMEPMEATHRDETHTLLLMQEAQKRGFSVFHTTPEEVYLRSGEVRARMRGVELDLQADAYYRYAGSEDRALTEMDVVMIRQDPPVDMAYMSSMYLLERVRDTVQVVNDPSAIIALPEKVYPFDFKEYMPPTLVAWEHEVIERFREKHGELVVKPLYGYHGHGIMRLKEDQEYIPSQNHVPAIFQPFLPEIYEGNKRVVFLNGEVAASLITKPGPGEFKIYRNSTDHAYELNARDKEMCEVIGADLKRRGLVFVGIDIIGDYLTEINVTSVGSIRRINQIYGREFEAEIWDAILAQH